MHQPPASSRHSTTVRTATILGADVALVAAHVVLFLAAPSNNKVLGAPALALSLLLAVFIAWAVVTTQGLVWLRLLSGVLLGVIILIWCLGFFLLFKLS